MKIWRPSMAGTSEGMADERRRHGRLKTEGTQSSLGTVLDMSASGMRVVRKGALPVREGEKFRVDLQIGADVIEMDIVIRRIQKFGMRKYEYGVEFINLTEEARMRLTRLARTASTSPRAMW